MDTEIAHASPPPVSRWWILFLVHASVLAFALNLQMIPPLIPRLVSEIDLSHSGAGLLMGLFTLPGIFLAIPGGRAADHMGPGKVALWSLLLLTIGVLLMLPLNRGFLYFGRLCSGIGGAVLVVAAPQIIARSFYGRELGLAMGIFNTAVPLGTMIAFNFLGYLGSALGTTVVFMTTVSLTLAIMAVFYLTYTDVRGEAPSPSEKEGMSKSWGLGGGIWTVSVIWALFNISILSYFTFAIDHFVDNGLAGSTARFLTSMPMLLSIFITPVAGLAMHRYGLRWSLALTGCLISSGTIYFLFAADRLVMTVLWSIALGIGISMVPPAVFTLAGELVPAARSGTGFGLLSAIFNLGVFFGIPLTGYVRDMTQSYRVSFILMAGTMVLAGILAAISQRLISKR